jgi:hypothetical protein
MDQHLPGCTVADSAVPPNSCEPCRLIGVGIALGRATEITREDIARWFDIPIELLADPTLPPSTEETP